MKLLPALFLLLLVPLQAHASGILRIGTECAYAPFTYYSQDGNIEGYDVDIARTVAERIGLEPVFVCVPFENSLRELEKGNFDILFSAYSITEERLKIVNFSLPYRSSTARFAAHRHFDSQEQTADATLTPNFLGEKTIGVQRTSTYERYLRDFFPNADLRAYDTVDHMIADLKKGRIDAVLAGPVKLWTTLLSSDGGENYRFIGPEIENPYYFGPGIAAALRKEDVDLLKKVNAALSGMYEDGTLRIINDKYWDFNVLPSVRQ